MRVLAIDTALEACSAAVLDTEQDGVVASESIPMVRGHAEALMPLIARVMSEARLEFLELDRVAVTIGPGSFTGLRVGVSAAGRASTRGGGALSGQCAAMSDAPEPLITVGSMTAARTALAARSSRGGTTVTPLAAKIWK